MRQEAAELINIPEYIEAVNRLNDFLGTQESVEVVAGNERLRMRRGEPAVAEVKFALYVWHEAEGDINGQKVTLGQHFVLYDKWLRNYESYATSEFFSSSPRKDHYYLKDPAFRGTSGHDQSLYEQHSRVLADLAKRFLDNS